jgi:hypothetical protein
MLSRVIVVAVLAVAVMTGLKMGVLNTTRLTGSCAVIQTNQDGTQWERCVSGRLEGRPSLKGRACTPQGVAGKYELWHCPSAVQATAFGR